MAHKFEIKGGITPQSTIVLMDGKPLEDVTSIDLLIDWNNEGVNKIRLEFVPDVLDIDVEAEVFITDKIKQLVKEIEEKDE